MQKKMQNFTKEKNILFLHGYLSNGKSFYNQLDFFGRDFAVFAPDFKGFGSNKEMPFAYSLTDYVNEIEEFKYKNGLIKPHVIAHSFGGRVALKSAYLDKNAFSKMVLTGCAGLKPKFSIKKFVKRKTFCFLKKFVSKNKLTKFYSEDYKMLSPTMQESFIKIVNEHLDYTLCEIENDVLIINGVKDRQTPPYMAKRLHKNIKNSKLIMLEGAGHFAFIDKPHKFNTEVKEFLLS